MRKINLASLKRRETNFIKKLEQENKFSYVSGYRGYKYPVIVKHNKCGNEIEVIAETVLSKKKADDCIHCTTSVRNKSIEQIQNEINKTYTNLKIIGEDTTKSKKKVYVIQCMTCNHTYKITYNQLKNKSFNCCSGGKSIYVRHLDNNVRQIMKAMKPSYLLGQPLYNYIEEFIEDLSYIKSKTVDKEKFIFDIYEEINYIYMEKKIAKCECCGEFKKGNEWGAYKSNYDNRVCYSCLIKMKECSVCSELKKQKEFDFDYKTKTFNDKCKKCNEIESNL